MNCIIQHISTFHLIRHGKKQLTPGDPPLSQEGVVEASKTADFLSKKHIVHIFSSPLKRAFQTASLIADKCKLSVQMDDRLRERMNWGDVDNQSLTDFLKIWDQTNDDRAYVPNSGRSSRQTGLDLQKFVEDISESDSNSEIAIVTHGGTIADFLLNVFHEKDIENVKPNFIAQKSSLIKECSITTVILSKKSFHLIDVATTDHL